MRSSATRLTAGIDEHLARVGQADGDGRAAAPRRRVGVARAPARCRRSRSPCRRRRRWPRGPPRRSSSPGQHGVGGAELERQVELRPARRRPRRSSTRPPGARPSSAARPTPPRPNTATRLAHPHLRASSTTAPTPVSTAQPNSAAISNGSAGSTFTAERAETTTWSANAETPRWWCRSLPPSGCQRRVAAEQLAGDVRRGAGLAQRGAARAARLAVAAGRDERQDHVVAGLEAVGVRARPRRPRRPPRGRAPSASRAGASRRSPTGRSGTARRRRRGRAARPRPGGVELELGDLERPRLGVRRRQPHLAQHGAADLHDADLLADDEPLERGAQRRGDRRPAGGSRGRRRRARTSPRRRPRRRPRGRSRARSGRSSLPSWPTRSPASIVSGNVERRLELAVRLDAQADHLAALDVEPALADQPGVDHGVEERVVLDVVDVAVDVVVLPARLDRQAVRVAATRAAL